MLDAQTIATVKSALPAVAAVGPKLTAHFYNRMLSQHPELKNVFNMNKQRNGDQREALFNAICVYGVNLDNLAALLPVIEKIVQKHTSLLIKPKHAIIGENLLATIEELLNPGEEVLADVLIYQETERQQGSWRGTCPFRISAIEAQSAVIKSLTLTPVDGGPLAVFKPSQYLTVQLHPAEFAFQQNRQYSLTHTSNGKTYCIAVKHDAQGSLSGWLHEKAQVGDVLKLTAPHGDVFVDVATDMPMALISVGVGVTLTLAEQQHAALIT